jgi:2-polyprenyl-6-methoxyphenol hydroxylase-like FAD-dependent oxidoreductase
MTDLEPLPKWVFGQSVLLGDAAHAMYPFGSNGASQAILDARVLAYELATRPCQADALDAYERQRLPVATAVQLANRRQAGEVMARVSELARSAEHQSAASELQRVERDYKRLAGFDIDTLNERPSLSVPPSSMNRVNPVESPTSTESDNWRQGK